MERVQLGLSLFVEELCVYRCEIEKQFEWGVVRKRLALENRKRANGVLRLCRSP